MTEIVQLYISKYLDVAKQSRDISEYAYRRGGLALLDFLDAERSYRATELGYRQTLASYLLALEQLREAVGTRTSALARPRGTHQARRGTAMRTTLMNVLLVLMSLGTGAEKLAAQQQAAPAPSKFQDDVRSITTKTGYRFNTPAGSPMALRPRCNGAMRLQAR